MEQEKDRLSFCWKLFTLAVLLIIGVASKLLPGSGVHARLDASEGTKSAAFEVSRQFRYGEISEPQLAKLKWALRQLPGDELQHRYGDHPSIRTVVLGEIMRAADAQLMVANSTLAKLDKMDSAAVKASAEKYKADIEERKNKLRSLIKYWPVITNVVREPAPWGNFMLVSYEMNLPEGMKLSFLPCALEYGDDFEPKRGKFEFDCLFMPVRNGNYQIRLPDPIGSDLADVKLDISADYSRATVEERSDTFALIDKVQPLIPETETLVQAYSRMKSILDDKAYF
ncbi:hypothetical protein [Rhizobium sp. BE258]|jgi:hypothetical protein|uniref:hypothetical protein n=1 Tax=Rhizobium sp. BE258 TaxID=2817722 RepID=UPI00285F510E|nr:hypothetical protein [Rhizobium sp. BE258]MDR7142213.1 hypothetical protein [Rhizobium sp. BE258]